MPPSASVTIGVEFRNLAQVQGKMQPGVIEEAMAEMFKKAIKPLHQRLEHRAPVDTGALRGSLMDEVRTDMAKVWTDITNPRTGFPYAAALATGGYIHRHGPFTGSPTAGYPDRAAQDFISQDLDGLAKALVQAAVKALS